MKQFRATYKAEISSLTEEGKTFMVERLHKFAAPDAQKAKEIALAHRKNIADSFMHRVFSVALISVEEQ